MLYHKSICEDVSKPKPKPKPNNPFLKVRYAQFYKNASELGKSELGEHRQDGISASPKDASRTRGRPQLPGLPSSLCH